jgi:hypothetical protein
MDTIFDTAVESASTPITRIDIVLLLMNKVGTAMNAVGICESLGIDKMSETLADVDQGFIRLCTGDYMEGFSWVRVDGVNWFQYNSMGIPPVDDGELESAMNKAS